MVGGFCRRTYSCKPALPLTVCSFLILARRSGLSYELILLAVWSMRNAKFLLKEVRNEESRVYYRVFADGVEFPSLVFIFDNQKTDESVEDLKTWCRNNAARLGSGAILHANLSAMQESRRMAKELRM